jgi:hypothetical protein
MTLSAFDSVHRGFVNTRANWELIFFQWLQGLLVVILSVAGLLPPLAVLGFAQVPVLSSAVSDWSSLLESVTGLMERGPDSWLLLLVSLGVSTAIWLIAMMVYCYFQGGIYGVLTAGDRQAPRGAPKGSQWFRTFSCRDWRGWGGHFMWRFFWLFNLVVLVSMLWLLLPVVLVLISVWGGEAWGTGAGFAIGCAGAIPLTFSLLVFALWASLAQATLVGRDAGVLQATRGALQVLGRRLGAVLFIFIVVILGSVFVSLGFSLLSAVLTLTLSQLDFVLMVGKITIGMIQLAFSSAFGIGLAATLIGLVRSETSGARA